MARNWTLRAAARGRSPALASALGVVLVLSLGGVVAVEALLKQLGGSGNVATGVGGTVFAVAFTAVGVLVARRQPRNPLGWLLIAVAICVQLSTLAAAYARLDYAFHRGRLPLGGLAVLLSPAWEYSFVLIPLVVLLFPDGSLGTRWRWPLRAYGALAAVFALGTLSVAVAALGVRMPVDSQGNLAGLNSPAGGNAWFAPVQIAGYAAAMTLLLVAIVRQVARFRRAASDQRQQLKWLSAGAAVLVACFLLNAATGGGSGLIGDLSFSIGLAALPLAMGVAILRYRLYDIDRIVSRTVSYAILTAALVGVFIGLVALTTNTLAISGRVGVAASTLAAAALFNPLRVRIQRLVDRRFNRARYDADATVAAFSARLLDAVEIDAIRGDLLETVNRALQPSHASIWIKS